MLDVVLVNQTDLAAYIFSFLDSSTLLHCLEISSAFYSATTQKNVWKDRWIWRTNAHPDSWNSQISGTYQLFRHIRNLEIDFLNQTFAIWKDNSSPRSDTDDQQFEFMNLLELECLLSLCEHSEIYHDSPPQNSLVFFHHLGLSDRQLESSFKDSKEFMKLIHQRHATINFFTSQKRWEKFLNQIFHSELSYFHQDLSCLVMEGLIHIAELQYFGCNYEVINSFVRSVTERSWHRLGEMFQILELLQHSNPQSYFPEVGWSLQSNSSNEIPQSHQHYFQRRREIVSSLDRSQVSFPFPSLLFDSL
jgi:hypothetical protein